MAADDKYSLLNIDNVTQQIQIQLSKKQKTFSKPFSTISKYWSNFEYFEKTFEPHRLRISDIMDCGRRG